MFEITGNDIAALNDEDLRSLIGLLCEAEMRRRGLPTSAVTWGGNQTAKDGGLDVRVTLTAGSNIDGFVPKAATGFQVKKPDMPRRAIIEEMKPNEVLRPVIAELASLAGAYVIVSSTGSTADIALKKRRDAMAEAVQDLADAGNLALDFYDRNRVATWVRDHAGQIPWVRSRIGKSIPGWQAFGAWSRPPAGADPAYLVDESARIRTPNEDEGEGLTAANGINRIRDVLREPGHVVRLVGLSGVGKTRLVEALFDPFIGANSLDPSLAIYTNIAESPDPQPVGLASDLIAGRTRAILVIDNCEPELHQQLTEIARTAGTTISVITVEYDIRGHQPEGTEVFVLETSSLPLIEKLVRSRFPHLSQVDVQTIANASGGNARVALAIAGTVEKNETVAGLSDADLFQRLFEQRHDPDPSLLRAAQACSLVYSFEGEKLSGDGAELPILGSLVGKSAEGLFEACAEIKRRELLQARGPWRAVLPHAIANTFAATALQNIPREKIIGALGDNAPSRLRQSFSRRLGYLNLSKEARAIVQGWLAPGGLLADAVKLDETGRAMFANVAPVMPDAALSALEASLQDADIGTLSKCAPFVRLLRLIAYDPPYFERAFSLLMKFARAQGEDKGYGDAAGVVRSFFQIVLSGTHAPLEMRLNVLRPLLRSTYAAERALGVAALEAALKTSHFNSTYDFDFGVRSRDYGYHPKRDEVGPWYVRVLKFAEPFAISNGPVAGPVRSAIAKEFRGLWTNVNRLDELEQISHAVASPAFWREGWIAARQTRSLDREAISRESLQRLSALEEFLRPKELVDRIRGMVLGAAEGLSMTSSRALKRTTTSRRGNERPQPLMRLGRIWAEMKRRSRRFCLSW